MVRRKHRLLSLLLSVLMVMSLFVVMTVSNTSAASGDTVYCENAAGWGDVYCYMWKDGSGDNGGWPGQKMTKGEGNLWSYNITGDWNMIIFNNGNGTQTSDMSYQGNGSCFNNQTSSWTTVEVPTNPTNPTMPTNPTPTTPTTPVPPEPTGKNVVYCKNEAGWSKVNVYMWTDGQGDNQGWPGVTATSIGDNIWMLEYDKDYAKIIFNDGSGTQTSDLNHPGSGQMYNNKTGQWSLYDTKSLHIKGVTADPASPQYTGVSIELTINAGGGEGALNYKFTATSGSNTSVISDFSADNSVTWTPTTAGTYTITYTVKDEAGAEKTQTASFQIKDIASETKPVLQSVKVTPTNSQNSEIQKGKEALVNIAAGGGNTGTKLLFYKIKITDPSGKTANVPYYTTKNQYKFTPTALGSYQIEVSVQSSDNTTVTRNYNYESVSSLSADDELTVSLSTSGKLTTGSTITAMASAAGGKAPYTYQFKLNGQVVKSYTSADSYAFTANAAGTYTIEVSAKDSSGKIATKSVTVTVTTPSDVGPGTDVTLKGDADLSGIVNVKDATAIQKHLAELIILTPQGYANAEVDGSGTLTVKDATMIQKHLAGMDVNW